MADTTKEIEERAIEEDGDKLKRKKKIIKTTC